VPNGIYKKYAPPGYVITSTTGCKFGVCPSNAGQTGLHSKGAYTNIPQYTPLGSSVEAGTGCKLGSCHGVGPQAKTEEELLCACKKEMQKILESVLGPGLWFEGNHVGPASPNQPPCTGLNAGQLPVMLYNADWAYIGMECLPLPPESDELHDKYMGCWDFMKTMQKTWGFNKFAQVWKKC